MWRRVERLVWKTALTLVLGCIVGVAPWGYGAEIAPGVTTLPSGATEGDAGATSGQGLTSGAYIIKVDDILTIEGTPLTPGLELKARSYRVSEDGTIIMPFIDWINVAGMSKRQLEKKLMELYCPDYFRNVVINVEVRSKTFNIIGDVRIPGVKELITETSILTAIALAGDFTEYANEKKVTVIRRDAQGNATRTVIDCKAIMDGKAPDDFIIKPNDLIVVPRSGPFG